MRRPNILLITSDQQHWKTLGGVNNPRIRTPNLDRLAKLGVSFSRAYCPNPTCTPTRASILTGRYPSYHGAWTLGTKLPEDVPTIGQLLKPAGYWSALIGKAHFQPLCSTPESPSVEAYPILRDLDYWRTFNATHMPWYGFDHVEMSRNHTSEGHVGQHYAIWLEEQGLHDWREYFAPRADGVVEGGSSKCPRTHGGGVQSAPWALPEHLHYTAWTGQRTIAAIETAHAERRPFFIWSSYHDPHPPYTVCEPWASMYDPDDVEIGRFVEGEFDRMPPPHHWTREPKPAGFAEMNDDRIGVHGHHSHLHDETALRKAVAIYYGMISFMDHWIGKTLDRLESLDELENTLIVFTSDHGHFIGQHGLIAKGPFHYEDVIRVPFIVAQPGKLSPRAEDARIQSLVDLAPTFLQAAGVDVPRGMQGISQLDTWRHPDAPPARDHAIVENHHNTAAVHLRTIVTSSHKLTVYRGRPEWGELFDLDNDPNELRNLYNDPAHADLQRRMFEALVQADLAREPAPMPRVWCA